ncbi:MAG: HAD family hydrolase [Bacteroidia bacterium]|nr:HAD family hydrolase [Bacteroidia bacterium]
MPTIFWDFDGVLLNSNAIRDKGFEMVLSEFPKEQVEELLVYHRANGGLSRYVKFRYFFENIRQEQLSDEDLQKWAKAFSEIMLANLCDPKLMIEPTCNFVLSKPPYAMHIVSGSDQTELRILCKELGLNQSFVSIHGSPKPKKEWVKELLLEYNYNPQECILIGDSINDWEAAHSNGISFMAYNNPKIEHLSNAKIEF